ncbi:MAG: DUF4345 domain-containing protein [Actinomycetota bacterium]
MSGGASRMALKVFLTILGSIALVAGLGTVLFGVDSIVGAEPVSGTVDSEMRFYAVWYAGAGVVILRAAARVESAGTTIRAVVVLFFVAGCSRALSWLVVGRPHTVAVALMVIELALPLVILPWQAAVARGNS